MKILKLTLSALLIVLSFSFAKAQKSDTYSKNGDKLMVTRYRDDGSIREQGTFENGKPDGQWVWLDENGNITRQAFYVDGKKDGKWFAWSNDRNYLYEINYDNNKLVGTHRWKIEDDNRIAEQ